MPADNLPIVPNIWCSPKSIPPEYWHEAYGTCLRGAKGHCINTNLVRVIAKLLGRKVTFVSTTKAHINWTEELPEGKFKYKAPIYESYTRMIDRYDETGQHFKMPAKCPFGPVICKGPSESARERDPLRIRTSKTKLRTREMQAPHTAPPYRDLPLKAE